MPVPVAGPFTANGEEFIVLCEAAGIKLTFFGDLGTPAGSIAIGEIIGGTFVPYDEVTATVDSLPYSRVFVCGHGADIAIDITGATAPSISVAFAQVQ